MSRENVDLVRSMFAAWERGDFRSTEWAHPDIEYVIADGLSPGTWRGLEGMAKAERQFLSGWEDYRAVAEEYRPLDDERVLVLARGTGRGRTSGLEIEQITAPQGAAALFHVQDTKVTKLVLYYDRDRAFADLGLPPDDTEPKQAMSQQSLEIVRQVLRGLSPDAAQERTIKSFVERLSPDLEFVEDPRFPEGGTYHGRDEYLRYARDFVAQFERFTFTVEGLRAIPDGRVLVALRLRGRGKGSGAEFDARSGWVYTVRNGLVVHIRAYVDLAEALEAVGLRE